MQETLEFLKNAVDNPKEAMLLGGQALVNRIEEFKNASPEDRSRAFGTMVTTVLVTRGMGSLKSMVHLPRGHGNGHKPETGRANNKLRPDRDATGPHTRYGRDDQGNIFKYETYEMHENRSDQLLSSLPSSEDDLDWLIEWFAKYSDAYWPLTYGVEVLSQPDLTWKVTIDLEETRMWDAECESRRTEGSGGCWAEIAIEDRCFIGRCDAMSLRFVLAEFKRVCIESGENLEPLPRGEGGYEEWGDNCK